MRPIKNEKDLPSILAAENLNWQKNVFDKIGVIVCFSPFATQLFSNCGTVDLDIEYEMSFQNGQDRTEYCEIHSTAELIAYIIEMESYSSLLVDQQVGTFSKSELFWAIYAQIILPEGNHNPENIYVDIDWRLNSIKQDQDVITLNMELCGYDEYFADVPFNGSFSLDNALAFLIKDLNETTSNLNDHGPYQIFRNSYSVPHKFEELKSQLQNIGFI